MKKIVQVKKREDGELYIELDQEILEKAGFNSNDTVEWIDNKDGSWSLVKVEDNLKYYVVDVLSTFRNRFVVKAKSLDHAMDEVVFREDDVNFVEFSQKHLGTQIIDGIEVSEEELMVFHKKDNDYISSWSKEAVLEKLTNTIKYED